jgi:hypothetical protein
MQLDPLSTEASQEISSAPHQPPPNATKLQYEAYRNYALGQQATLYTFEQAAIHVSQCIAWFLEPCFFVRFPAKEG